MILIYILMFMLFGVFIYQQHKAYSTTGKKSVDHMCKSLAVLVVMFLLAGIGPGLLT